MLFLIKFLTKDFSILSEGFYKILNYNILDYNILNSAISSRHHGVRGEDPLMNQYLVEGQQAKSMNTWTVFITGEVCKGSQETFDGTWATSGVHKDLERGASREGTRLLMTPMWIALQELTTLYCRRISQYWGLGKKMAQETQCWYRHKHQRVWTHTL